MRDSKEVIHRVDRKSNIRAAEKNDVSPLMKLIRESGLFPPEELAEVGELLAAYVNKPGIGDQRWITDDDHGLVGVAYYAPERMTDGTWNLYLIAVHPDHRGHGRGAALLSYVEEELAARGQRILLVETSGLASFEKTRSFYRRCGYDEEAKIRDFYKAGEDKVIFRKSLASPSSPGW